MIEKLLHRRPSPKVLREIEEHVRGAKLLRRYTFVIEKEDSRPIRILQMLVFYKDEAAKIVLQEAVGRDTEVICTSFPIDEMPAKLSELFSAVESCVYEESAKSWKMYVDIFGQIESEETYYN